ncbi:MAG TPA: peptidoglycan-associated lipoprotein Pal, partial [Nitrospina sp.]|nr:peptidoglycan-associated lipoprotein Pal [Nitrospina sp.]
VFLTTACSKKLLPPEIETSASVSEESEFVPSSSSESSENSFGGSGGPVDSGFFSEEPIIERSSSSDSSTGSMASNGSGSFSSSGPGGTDGQANIGNGSTGSFSAKNPFASNSGNGSGSGSGMDSGIQESRLQSFTASSDLKDIHFKFDQYDLDDNSRAVLQKNAEYLKNNPNLHVEVQGHCDERGTNNYNIALGERRAHSTKKYLVAQGVNSRNVHVISYGEEKPFCFSSGEVCWQENRRAHFMVSK